MTQSTRDHLKVEVIEAAEEVHNEGITEGEMIEAEVVKLIEVAEGEHIGKIINMIIKKEITITQLLTPFKVII